MTNGLVQTNYLACPLITKKHTGLSATNILKENGILKEGLGQWNTKGMV